MMRVRKLTIDAFRGVRDSLYLDFSHPINLIYAPNGTGKTSVCDAVEWLLTGQIKRLGISGSQIEDIRCALSDENIETKVSAEFELEGESMVLHRTLDGIQWRRGDSPLERVTLSELLEALAPSAVEPDAHPRHAISSRQIWLRGTRFLSAESLAALLDSDDNSLENRTRLFSDLLGVGHLLETERLLGAYGKQIDLVLKQQEEKISDKITSINARQQTLNQEAPKTEEAVRELVLECLKSARDALGLTNEGILGEPLASRPFLLETNGEIDQRKTYWNRKRLAEIELARDWPERFLIETQTKEATTQLQQKSALAAEKIALLDAAQKELNASDANLAGYRSRISQAADRLQKLLGAVAYAYSYSQQYDARSSASRLTVLESMRISANEGSESLRSRRASILKNLTAEVGERQRDQEELTTLRQQRVLALTELKNKEELEALQAELVRAQEGADNTRKNYDRVAGPLQQLQFLSASVVDLLQHERNCPVCKHDWESPSDLMAAIQEAIKSTPESIRQLEKEVEAAATLVRSVAHSLTNDAANQRKVGDLSLRIKRLEDSQVSFVARLAEIGISAESATVQRDIELAELRLNLADGVERFQGELNAVQALLGITVPQDVSFDDFTKIVSAAGTEAIKQLNAAYAAASKSHAPLVEQRDALKAQIQMLDTDQQALRARIAGDLKRLNTLKESWHTLTGDIPWTDDARDRITSDLRAAYDQLSVAQQSADQASRYLEQSLQLGEITQLKNELEPLIAERDRLTALSEAAHKAKLAYDERLQKHVRTQMEVIVKVISALFLRMQANEVYDRIVEGSESQPLSWRAMCNGTPLDPEKKFSQGQRQDFALAIFLARARGLRGSFFMDEPLAHLDDLNRVALLDVFRAVALERDPKLSFILTTASRSVARHFLEKFWRIDHGKDADKNQLLNAIELEGNPRIGVRTISYTQ